MRTKDESLSSTLFVPRVIYLACGRRAVREQCAHDGGVSAGRGHNQR